MGSMALLRALRDGIPMKSAAIIGSGDKIRNVFYRFSEQLQFSDKVTERMIQIVEKQFGMNLESHSSSMSLKHLELPLLIVHDKDDKETLLLIAKTFIKLRTTLNYYCLQDWDIIGF